MHVFFLNNLDFSFDRPWFMPVLGPSHSHKFCQSTLNCDSPSYTILLWSVAAHSVLLKRAVGIASVTLSVSTSRRRCSESVLLLPWNPPVYVSGIIVVGFVVLITFNVSVRPSNSVVDRVHRELTWPPLRASVFHVFEWTRFEHSCVLFTFVGVINCMQVHLLVCWYRQTRCCWSYSRTWWRFWSQWLSMLRIHADLYVWI